MTIFAETPRLILREITMEDVDGFFDIDSDPEVHKYLGTQPVTSKNQIVDIIKSVRQQYIDNGIGRWAIVDKSTNRFIGWTGLKLVKDVINNQTNYYDLGYRLIRKYWGQGIATKTAIISLNYGFEKLNLNEIIATVNCENSASNNVVSKIGFKMYETFYLHGLKHSWYKIDKAGWLKSKPAQ
ncbi:MAG TPA: GNAT family N-acetyltransferase [Chitinophagaceae bacterium]|nr:GNAT family N-acetyltransferase [Chitinophagaceae bacterium]